MRSVFPVLVCAPPAPPVVSLFSLVLRSLSEELVEERSPFHSPRAIKITPFFIPYLENCTMVMLFSIVEVIGLIVHSWLQWFKCCNSDLAGSI